jgi:NAD(P)-dependent dehydrogenase (short-subunit alcohol dehydrogenase family)
MTENTSNRVQAKLGSGLDPKSEPSDILAGKDLTGKVAVVTGGYSGIGLETTRALAAAGAKVYVPVRNVDKAAETLATIERGEVIPLPMDLGDFASVRRFVAEMLENESQIDLLINNAGIMACPEARIEGGWESQFGVNHLGHFVLTKGLLPALLAADSPRVVSLSSIGHRRGGVNFEDINFEKTPYEKWTAYAQAKTANALFALGLDMKYADQGLRAFSVHPGGIMTPLQRHLQNEEMIALGWLDENGNLSELAAALFKSTTQGCTTTLWAATSDMLDGKGGLYCEDCDVAELADEDTPRYFGVAQWAVDPDLAVKLWELSESATA